MLGPVIIVLALLVFPVVLLVSMAAAAWALGSVLTSDAETRHAGSELVELNR